MNVNFLISFSAGVVSVISPCVLPLIPIVVGHSLLQKRLSGTISFILGFFLVFSIITTLTVIFTAAINHYLFYLRISAAFLLMVLGIVLIIDKNIFKFSHISLHKGKNMGSFMVGFLTCLAWSPCYGPYIIAVVAYSASSGNLVYIACNIALFAAGFSLTLLIIGFLTSKLDLEKIIKYSDLVKIGSGAIIFVAGLYLLLNLL